MKTLTKAEEQIMQVIWKLGKAFLREIIDGLQSPKPHKNTVATILKILVEKDFVGITVYGRTHQYYTLISKETYSKGSIKSLVKGYFEGSFSNAVSFMVKENNLSIEELELLLKQLKRILLHHSGQNKINLYDNVCLVSFKSNCLLWYFIWLLFTCASG